jgi:gas vesicle structural protein
MAAAVRQPIPMSQMQRQPGPSGLADVLDVLLDKGLVIDVYLRVSLIGIELLTVDARIVVASVDTYLRFAEAVNRLDLTQVDESETLPELFGDMEEKGAGRKTKGVLEGAKNVLFGDDDSNESSSRSSSRKRSSSSGTSRKSSSRARKSSSNARKRSSSGSRGR